MSKLHSLDDAYILKDVNDFKLTFKYDKSTGKVYRIFKITEKLTDSNLSTFEIVETKIVLLELSGREKESALDQLFAEKAISSRSLLK